MQRVRARLVEGSSPWPANSVGPGQESSPWPCHLGPDGLAKPQFLHLQGGRIGPPSALWGGALPGRRQVPAWPAPPLERPGEHSPNAARVLRPGSKAGSPVCTVATRVPPPRPPCPLIQAEPPNRRSPSSAPPLRPASPQARLFLPPWRGGAGHAVNIESVIGPPVGGRERSASDQ